MKMFLEGDIVEYIGDKPHLRGKEYVVQPMFGVLAVVYKAWGFTLFDVVDTNNYAVIRRPFKETEYTYYTTSL